MIMFMDYLIKNEYYKKKFKANEMNNDVKTVTLHNSLL